MSATFRMRLNPGSRYRVRTHNQRKTVERIYKWPETRLGSIPCHVFTARVASDVSASWDGTRLTITGSKVPRSELSIPEYDLAEATAL